MMRRSLLMTSILLLLLPVLAAAQPAPADHDHDRAPAPAKNFLAPEAENALRTLLVQDYQGRMKPLDTLALESLRKITKSSHFQDWEPIDLYMSWIVHAPYWFDRPLVAVRNPDVKSLLGVSPDTKHVSVASLIDERGQLRIRPEVEEAFRTSDKERVKFQRKLLDFHERVNLLLMSFNQVTLRIYPVPHDENNTWLGIDDLLEQMPEEHAGEFRDANARLMTALRSNDTRAIVAACAEHKELQARYGSQVHISRAALGAELFLNRVNPFQKLMMPLLVSFLIFIIAYIRSLARMQGRFYSLKQPLYLLGSLIYWFSALSYLVSFIMRWVASGRAPVSNGYESLIWIGLLVLVAGLIFELVYRKGLVAGLASLLAVIILGVSMLSTFNPAIGPLVPVLNSYWLNIHVTTITSSYAFLGLSALVAMTLLVLHLFKGPGRENVRSAVMELHNVHWWIMVTGLGLLSVGTLLGGVWANESWGRYWGWDSKETWSLVTILVYAIITHFKYIPSLSGPWTMAAASFIGISAVIMTYFGVNYFLSGLHSYAAGDAAQVPRWIWIAIAAMLALLFSSWWRDQHKSWQGGARA